MALVADKPEGKPDGRKLRAERTRAAIVDALLALVDGGNLQPTAQEVADRAGVALRSIAQHFPTRDDLLLAGAAQYAQRAGSLHAPVPTSGSRAVRVAGFVKVRAQYLETTAGVRRAAMLHLGQRTRTDALGARAIRGAFQALSGVRRDEVAAAFAREVEGDDDKLESLHVVSSGAFWDALRRDLGLSRRLAERRVAALLDALTR